MPGKKVSNADRFTQLFDQDWSRTKSQLRTQLEDRRAYDVSNSWDARSDHPDSFTRLGQTIVPYQKSAPIVLSGASVVPLEENTGFSAINVKHPDHQKASIPLTLEQQDAQMTKDLSGTVALREEVRSSGNSRKTIVMTEQPGFANMNLKNPSLVALEKPEFMVAAGPNADQRLLNPAQRREFHRIDQQEKDAAKLLKKAELQRRHTKEIMGGPFYKRGVLMVDSSDNIHSEVYGARATEELADKEYMRQIHLERMSRLANKTASMQIYGNILVPDTLGPRVKIQRSFQSKGGDYHGLSFDETHNRIFCRLQGSTGSNRTQLLRDIETSGKDYNITQHTLIEHWPPRHFERQVERSMGHPSQQALEGQRNLQGTIRPF
jgi:hypothetical protein